MKRYLYYGIAAILITACSQNELSEVKSLPEVKELVNLTSEEYASIAFDNPRELTESEAICGMRSCCISRAYDCHSAAHNGLWYNDKLGIFNRKASNN